MIAKVEQQSAFSALTKSVQGQWNYFQSVAPECDANFSDLERAIAEMFIPADFGVKSLPLNKTFLSSLPE